MRNTKPYTRGKPPRRGLPLSFVWIVATVAVIGLGLFGYKYFATNDTSVPNNPAAQSPAGGSGAGVPSGCASGCQPQPIGSGGGRQLITTKGTVTAVSASSITIQPSGGGRATTFSVTSDTQVFDGANDISISDIHTGDYVLVGVGSAGSTQAVDIVLNPSS